MFRIKMKMKIKGNRKIDMQSWVAGVSLTRLAQDSTPP